MACIFAQNWAMCWKYIFHKTTYKAFQWWKNQLPTATRLGTFLDGNMDPTHIPEWEWGYYRVAK